MKLEGHRTNRYLVLTPSSFARLLTAVANEDAPGSKELFVRLAATWGGRTSRAFVTFHPTSQERQILRDLAVIPSTRKPNHKESRMARKAKAAPVVDDIDELEAELEGLEEVDEDIEDQEDSDEGEDYSTLTAAQLKALCKERGIKGITQKNKTALIAMLEANDASDDDEDEEEDEEEEPDEVEEDDEEEEDEEEDDGLDYLSRADLKAHIKSEGLDVKVFKSDSDEDIVAKIREATGDDEEDEEPEPPKRGRGRPKGSTNKTSAKGTAKGKAKAAPMTRALPQGRLGANDIAEMAGTSALNVRNFLRSDAGAAWPKNEELGRYAFTAKQAQAIVKAMSNRTRATPAKKAPTKTTTKGKTTRRK